MDIDEFLDKEASKMGGKAQIQEKNTGTGKQGTENILDQLQTVKNQLRENHVDSALKEFDYLKSRYTDMTKKQLSENRYIFNELMRINQEIINKIDSQRSDFEKRTQIIKKLLNDAYRRSENGELQTAYKLYIEMTEIIKNMSDLFLEDKNRINYEVMSFAAQIFPKLQEQTDHAFEQKKNLILHEINQAYQQLQSNNGELPPKVYENINNLFQQLPEGHIYEKTILYNDILKLFRSSSLSGEASSLVNEMLKQQSGFANSVLQNSSQRQETIPGQDIQRTSTQDQAQQFGESAMQSQTNAQQPDNSMQSLWHNQDKEQYPGSSQMTPDYIQKNPQEFPKDSENKPQNTSLEQNQSQKKEKKGLFKKLFNKKEKSSPPQNQESNDNEKKGLFTKLFNNKEKSIPPPNQESNDNKKNEEL